MQSADLKRQTYKEFAPHEHETWALLYEGLDENRLHLAHPKFAAGLKNLGFTHDRVPPLHKINEALGKTTGWKGIAVEGLEMGDSFYPGLARKEFPIGNFIRDKKVLGYTPAPDVFHDLYGHIPFFADADFANFCQRYGELVSKYLYDAEMLKKFERFFWFTIEFALIETPNGRKIFGGGLLSSREESLYAMSDQPTVLPFDIRDIIHRNYKIDEFQKVIYVLKNENQLYQCLPELETIALSS